MKPTEMAAVLSVVLVGCGVWSSQIGAIDCSDFARTFFRKPTQTQIKEFGEHNIDEQYALFLCGNQIIHPPAIYLAEPFSDQGQKAVEFLKLKLADTQNDLTIRDVIRVFVEMNRRGTYRVAEDTNLMKLMTESARRIKDPEWRHVTDQMVSELRR